MFIFHKISFLESSSLCCSRPERFHQRVRPAPSRLGEIIWFPPMICKNSTLDLKREVCFLLAQNCCGCPLLIMSWIKPRSTRKFIFKDENLTKLHTFGVVAARRKKRFVPIFCLFFTQMNLLCDRVKCETCRDENPYLFENFYVPWYIGKCKKGQAKNIAQKSSSSTADVCVLKSSPPYRIPRFAIQRPNTNLTPIALKHTDCSSRRPHFYFALS